MHWKVLDTEVNSAEKNMEIDQMLLEHLTEPTIHFYDWQKPSATYGYFVDPKQYLDLEKAAGKNLDLARRPTGGGIIFHIWDFAFSVLLPNTSSHFSLNTLHNYAFVNEAVLQTVHSFLGSQNLELIKQDEPSLDTNCGRFCMAKPTKYDVVLNGKKIAGAAQRRDKRGFLHQGSISLALPDFDYLSEVLLPGTKVIEAMQNFTYPIISAKEGPSHLMQARRALQHALEKQLSEMY